MTRRVLITGRSALTAAGANSDATWSSILAGTSGLSEIKGWDISSWTHRLGGELTQAPALPDRKLMRSMARQDIMGIQAAMQAITHSQCLEYRDTLSCATQFNAKTGVYVGSPGNKYFQQYDFLPLISKTNGDMADFAENLFSEVHPMWLLRILPNNVLAYTGMLHGFNGPNHNITNHAVSGMQAILEAYHAIKSGQIERAVVVAYDTGIEPQALFYYAKLGVISARYLKPFDLEHDGTILAEGASALVLESEASAAARQAACYAEVVAGASATEGAGLFSVEKTGNALATLLANSLKQAELSAADIGLVVAHGNGNPPSDCSEARAISHTFGDQSVPVTAFKWAMGHTLCTSGVLDTVLATYALRDQVVPGIAGLDSLSAECSGLNARSCTRSLSGLSHAMIINRGFASMNAALVIRACE